MKRDPPGLALPSGPGSIREMRLWRQNSVNEIRRSFRHRIPSGVRRLAIGVVDGDRGGDAGAGDDDRPAVPSDTALDLAHLIGVEVPQGLDAQGELLAILLHRGSPSLSPAVGLELEPFVLLLLYR